MQSTVYFVANTTDGLFNYYWHVIRRLAACGVSIRGYAPRDSEIEDYPTLSSFSVERAPFFRTTRSPLRLLQVVLHAWSMGRSDPKGIFTLYTVMPHVLYGIPLRVLNRRCVFIMAGTGTIFRSPRFRHRLARPVAAGVYRFLYSGRNSRVVVQNRDHLKFVRTTLKASPQTTFLMPGCGVDPDRFPFFPRLPQNERKVILIPARLVRTKGVYEACDASALLLERGVDHEMWFTHGVDPGSPLSMTEQEIEDLQRANDRLRFLGWQPAIAPLYEACDIVCLPTYSEGLPSTLLEASACGRPMVATDVDGCREVVTHEVTGLLAPVRSASGLAEALERLIKDPELGDRLRQNAYRQFQGRFTKEKSASAILPAYQGLGLDVE